MPDRPARESKKTRGDTARPAGQPASAGRKARGSKKDAAAGPADGSGSGAAGRGRKRGAAAAPAKTAAPAKAAAPANAATRSPRGLSVPAQTVPMKRPPVAAARADIRKTYKLYIGGAFPRSESGRSYPVTGPEGGLLAHAARASRKDARDAVVAARKAVAGWSGATAYNRGQVLYRVAEMLEGRADQFTAECVRAEGLDWPEAQRTVAASIDRWVWYAGWPDKVAQVTGAANPVAGPYFNFSVPEPTGVVAVVAPQASALLGLVSVLAPVIATGNTAVLIASEAAPLPAISLSEVLGTSDVPGGVVNVLTGYTAELAPVLAAHMDVNAIDLTGVDPAARAELEKAAAGNVKRIFAADEDWLAPPTPARMLAFLETKTVWHPIGV